MVQRADLFHAQCSFCRSRKKTPDHRYPDWAELLRSSKRIHSEMLPLLYSEKTLHMKCLKCEQQPGHSPLWQPLKFATKHIEHYHGHVHFKKIAIAYAMTGSNKYSQIREFPSRWPAMEHKILECFNKTEHVSLRIRCPDFDTTFHLARRNNTSSIEHIHGYRTVLAEHKNVIAAYDFGRSSHAILEETCDAVVLSHAQGYLKDTAFGVQSLCWKPSSKGAKEVVMDLGCDKHSASDATMEQILALPRPFKVQRLQDWAGV